MKMGHVSSLLPDYIDGLLSPGEASAVKEHLARCAGCREEHRFVKEYTRKAAAFPIVPVPDDFLEKIHARIDAPAPSGILGTLFFPLKIKLPLEAAGALALTVLAIFIFKPFGDRGLEYHAEAPVVSKQAAESRKEADAAAPGRQGEETLARDADSARTEHAALRKRAPVDAGRMTVANGAKDAKIASAEEKADSEAPFDMNLVLKPGVEASRTGGTARSRDTRQGIQATDKQKGAYSAQSETAASDYTRAAELPAKNQALVDVIVNQAWALDGRVIKVADADATGFRRLVIVEIPAKNYAQFMSGIKGAWSVQKQTPAALPAPTGRIRINMSLQD